MITLWTSVEQIVSHIWERRVRAEISAPDEIPGRKAFLSDNRTWSISTRLEMLYQKGLLSTSAYRELDEARKARNAFIHSGKTPSRNAVTVALSGMFKLLSLCRTEFAKETELDPVKEMILSKVMYDQHPHAAIKQDKPRFWRGLPLLPGEANWEGDFEAFELGFKPIQDILDGTPQSEET